MSGAGRHTAALDACKHALEVEPDHAQLLALQQKCIALTDRTVQPSCSSTAGPSTQVVGAIPDEGESEGELPTVELGPQTLS